MLFAHQFSDLRALRSRLRELRNELSPKHQKLHCHAICEQAEWLLTSRQDSHIGSYNAFDGEPPLDSLRTSFPGEYWFPVIDRQSNQMTFSQGSKEQLNRYGISEPQASAEIALGQLSLIFVPLVGYDKHCNRIGIGKGFYDRALQNRDPRSLLVGIAHSCQQVNRLTPQAWDVPLDCVITETGMIYRPA